jgi:hypothetical protein
MGIILHRNAKIKTPGIGKIVFQGMDSNAALAAEALGSLQEGAIVSDRGSRNSVGVTNKANPPAFGRI